MGLSVDGGDAVGTRRAPADVSCTDVASLIEQVVLAVLCDPTRARVVADRLLDDFRSWPSRPGSIDDAARIGVARLAYEAALVEADPGPTVTLRSDDRRLAVLSTIEPRSRAILVLHDVIGFDVGQISRVVRRDGASVAVELFRTRRSLSSLSHVAG